MVSVSSSLPYSLECKAGNPVHTPTKHRLGWPATRRSVQSSETVDHCAKLMMVASIAPLDLIIANESKIPVICWVSILDDKRPIVAKVAPRPTSSTSTGAIPGDADQPRAVRYFTRNLRGRIANVRDEVCVIILRRPPGSRYPKYFLSTDLSLSPQEAMNLYRKRWPVEIV